MYLSPDSIGGAPMLSPQSSPTTHTVAPGETLLQIADTYGVTPQALREANPELFRDTWRQDEAQQAGRADPIFHGDTLNIPAAPMSVTEGSIDSPYDAGHGTSKSEYAGAVGSVKVMHNPGDNVTRATQTNETGADSIFKISNEVSVEVGWTKKDGSTEFSVVGANVTLVRAEGRAGPFEAEGAIGIGFRARYKVILPGENHDPAQVAQINPFDPSTIPPGASVIMDGQQYEQTDLAGSFKHIGGESQVKDARGSAYVITRDPHSNQVTVMKGPCSALESFSGGGLRFNQHGVEASISVGGQTNVSDSTLRTARFDLDSSEGRAAYERFVVTGRAEQGEPGVEGVATVQRLDVSSQGRIKLHLATGAAELEGDIAMGGANAGSVIQTTHPDGSIALTREFSYGDNVPLTVTQYFDAHGNEVRSERTYEYTVDTGGQGNHSAQQINWVLSGGVTESGPAQPGQKLKLTFTEAEMQSLNAKAEKAGDTMPQIAHFTDDGDGRSASTLQFAIGMARNMNQNKYGFAGTLLDISDAADGHAGRGFVRLDMDVRRHVPG
ncbi:LysM domain-containing protein [Lysobacter firmicutimachus]|uniref:LysM domain-containing protein n=1 Tax=Lysobacter firmicutimachus TaxID=1792846 RepID=A0ABU8D7Y3_9GAMM